MGYCSKCGTLNAETSIYCSNCGALLSGTEAGDATRRNRTATINKPLIIVGSVAFVVLLILGVFLINGPYSRIILVTIPIVGVLIAEWSRHQRRREKQHP